MIKKGYAETVVAGGSFQTHFRHAGKGPAVVVLHPSPMSSAFMVPIIKPLASFMEVFAPDTPGYGASDPLPVPGTDLVPYVDWLEAFLRACGLEQVILYGSATGAQIAIEFSKRHPDQVQHLIVENAVHFTDEERAEIMTNYFPDLSPREDGEHLLTAWRLADRLYRWFPWFETPPEGAVEAPAPPLEVIQATAMAYLVAGPDYSRAYRAAFDNERAERLAQVPVPSTVLRWSGSLLSPWAARFDDHDWPPHIVMRDVGPGTEARFEALVGSIREAAASR